jgi:hypothetical protein
MYIGLYIHTHMSTYIQTYIGLHIYVHRAMHSAIYIWTCKRIFKHRAIYTWTCKRIFKHIGQHIYLYIYLYLQSLWPTCICIHSLWPTCICIHVHVTHQSIAMGMGVVRHEVKTSAGNSGFCGSSSPALQAASLKKQIWKISALVYILDEVTMKKGLLCARRCCMMRSSSRPSVYTK